MIVERASGINWRQTLIFLLTATVILITDQVTKNLVRANMTLGQSIPEEGRFRLSYTTNSGSIFGLPLDGGFLLIMSSVVVVLIICLQVFYLRTEIKLMLIGLGLVLGGAMGNLLDRIRFGAVTDFLDVRLWGDFHWAIFNVADAALSTGIVILIYYLLIMAKNIDQPDTHE